MPSDAANGQWRRAGLRALEFARQFGAFLVRFIKVAVPTVIGLSFVAAAALLISIIQFQIRIIEAKTQSKTFSLTSLIQSVALQKEFTASVRKIQETEAVVARFQELREAYLRQSSQIISNVCASYKLDNKQDCAFKISSILGTRKLNSNMIYNYAATMTNASDEQVGKQLKIIVDQAMTVFNEQDKFLAEHGNNLSDAKLACQIISNYLASEGNLALAQGFLPVYVTVASNRCAAVLFTIATVPMGAALGAGAPPGAAAATAITSDPSAQARRLEGDLSGALFFDVIAYFRFYENMLNGLCRMALAPFGSRCDPRFGTDMTEQIVIAPIDISFVILVVTCGALGAMLRISAETYNPKLFGKDVADTDKKTWVYYFVIGIMCSLIVYILARTVFAGLVDTTYVAKSGNMSPFVIAFMAIVSGLLCEEAFQQIIRAGKATLARSTGGNDQTADQGGGKTP
jgi:hypothetical protein